MINPEQPAAAPAYRRRGAASRSLAAAAALFLFAAQGHAATGTIQDVQHVVILMQENRSFDHYYGAMGGVRGFNDRSILMLTNGNSDLFQPYSPTQTNYVLPYQMPAPCIDDVDHSESTGLDAWNEGGWNAWLVKGTITMGHYARGDMPYHYSLADAYTICDNNYCSFIGPTFPNRLYLFTGMVDPNGTAGGPVLGNNMIPTNGLTWMTYPERLQAAGVSWKVYRQNGDWFGDALMWFSSFMNAQPGDPLYDRGMTEVPDQIAAVRADVTNGTLPSVSWVIPNIVQSEHPSAAPASGEVFVEQLLTALQADTNVYNSTVLIINYDENGGFFDHLQPPVPPPGTPDEFVHGEPLGLGIRVPLVIVSPWTRGGRVCSQLFDHTSVLRFLETWSGVQEPTISAWRRQVCGDLTSAFDFANPDFSIPALAAIPPVTNSTIVDPVVPTIQSIPLQETNMKVACPLPYQPNAASATECASNAFLLSMTNSGAASVHFAVYANAGLPGYPLQFDVLPGTSTNGPLAVKPGGNEAYDFSCYGPNGFQRRFAGSLSADCGQMELSSFIDATNAALTIVLTNGTSSNLTYFISDEYGLNETMTNTLTSMSTETNVLTPPNGWYDVSVTCNGDSTFWRLLEGHIETGAFSTSDIPVVISSILANRVIYPTNAPVAPPVLPVVTPPTQSAPNINSFAAMVTNLVANNPAPPPGNPPMLLGGVYGAKVALLYPAWASNCFLQYSPDLVTWTTMIPSVSTYSNYTIITQPATNFQGFFRLTH